MTETILEIKISKSYGENQVLKDIWLSTRAKLFIIGSSGSGAEPFPLHQPPRSTYCWHEVLYRGKMSWTKTTIWLITAKIRHGIPKVSPFLKISMSYRKYHRCSDNRVLKESVLASRKDRQRKSGRWAWVSLLLASRFQQLPQVDKSSGLLLRVRLMNPGCHHPFRWANFSSWPRKWLAKSWKSWRNYKRRPDYD